MTIADPGSGGWALGLGLLIVAGLGTLLLWSPIVVALEVDDGPEAPELRTTVHFWGQSWRRTFPITLSHLKPAPSSNSSGFQLGELAAVWHGVRIYLNLVDPVAEQARIERLSVRARLALGRPDRTALGLGVVNGILALGAGRAEQAEVSVIPEWSGFSLAGAGLGIFRWRGVDIMRAVMRALRGMRGAGTL